MIILFGGLTSVHPGMNVASETVEWSCSRSDDRFNDTPNRGRMGRNQGEVWIHQVPGFHIFHISLNLFKIVRNSIIFTPILSVLFLFYTKFSEILFFVFGNLWSRLGRNIFICGNRSECLNTIPKREWTNTKTVSHYWMSTSRIIHQSVKSIIICVNYRAFDILCLNYSPFN